MAIPHRAKARSVRLAAGVVAVGLVLACGGGPKTVVEPPPNGYCVVTSTISLAGARKPEGGPE